MHNTIWKKMKVCIAKQLNRIFPAWCWVHLFQWSMGDIRFSEVDRDCHDAEQSSQPACWCGKKCSRNKTDLQIREMP